MTKVLNTARQQGIEDFVLEMVMIPGGDEIGALRRSYKYLQNLQLL